MKIEEARFMWLMCFFDLPVGTKTQRKMASKFRIHLKDDGFIMLQFSVYARLCRGEDGSTKHIERIRSKCPKEGSIRLLTITDKQYGRMKLMLGTAKKTEEIAGEQLVLL
jgi:CRISPR-associated protein Cas2